MRTPPLIPNTRRIKLKDNGLEALAQGQPECWTSAGDLIVARTIAPAGLDRRSFTRVANRQRPPFPYNDHMAGLIWLARRNHGLSEGDAYELLFEVVDLADTADNRLAA